MNKKNRFRALLLAVACFPLTALDDFDAALFGISGMVAGETARINVTNIAAPPTTPPAPCRAQLSFVDAAGNTVLNGDAQPVLSQVTLAPGNAASLTLPAPSGATGLANRFAFRPVGKYLSAPGASVASSLNFAPVPSDSTSTFGGNVTLARAVIRQIGTPNPTTPQCGIVTSAELVDSNSGITTSVAPPVLPLFSPRPY